MAPETEENKLCPGRTSFPPAVWSLPIARANDLCPQVALPSCHLWSCTMTPSLSLSLKPSRLGMVSLPSFPSSLSLHPCVYLDCILPSCGEGRCQGQGPWQVNSTVSGSQTSPPPASTAHQENQSLVPLGKEQVMYESVCGCQVLICVPVNKKPLKSIRQAGPGPPPASNFDSAFVESLWW